MPENAALLMAPETILSSFLKWSGGGEVSHMLLMHKDRHTCNQFRITN